jgi:hypothetical protein
MTTEPLLPTEADATARADWRLRAGAGATAPRALMPLIFFASGAARVVPARRGQDLNSVLKIQYGCCRQYRENN